jgi:proline dehydrogenase
VGGENISDCLQAIEALGKFNIGAILDYSVEGKEAEADFDHCCAETIETIERARNDKNIPFCVFKVTGLARFALLEKVTAGEKLSEEETKEYKRCKKTVVH